MDTMATTKKVIYSKASDYRIISPTGAWGGPTTNGSVFVELYVERQLHPQEESLVVDETTNAILPGQPIDTNLGREIQAGLILRADTAFMIGQFLIQKALLAGFQVPEDDK